MTSILFYLVLPFICLPWYIWCNHQNGYDLTIGIFISMIVISVIPFLNLLMAGSMLIERISMSDLPKWLDKPILKNRRK
jgi:hypothetical protein